RQRLARQIPGPDIWIAGGDVERDARAVGRYARVTVRARRRLDGLFVPHAVDPHERPQRGARADRHIDECTGPGYGVLGSAAAGDREGLDTGTESPSTSRRAKSNRT